jgi:hypothetical protein
LGGRCVSPTSATDSRHVHPWTVRLPSARLAPCRSLALLGVSRVRSRRQTAVADDPAPGERALDGASPASAVCTRAPGGGAPSFSFPEERRYSTAAFSTACRAGDRPLTSPVAPALRPLPGCRRPAFAGRRPKEQEPGPLPSRPRQSARLATAQDAFHRQVPSGAAFAVPRFEGPPPYGSALPPIAGFRRSFASRALARRG